jgi:hypothetical protein
MCTRKSAPSCFRSSYPTAGHQDVKVDMLWLANTLRLNPGLKLKFSPRGQSMFGRQVRREKIEEDLRTLCRVIVEKEDVWVEKLRAARLVFTTKTNTWVL